MSAELETIGAANRLTGPVLRAPGDAANGWLDAAARPWHAELEAHADQIRREMEHLLERKVWFIWGATNYSHNFTRASEAEIIATADRSPKERIGAGDIPRWRLFGLYLKGRSIDANCILCPHTTAVVSRIPLLVNAGFSCLEAGYRLHPHAGYDNTLYRTHLGLRIPEGDCALRVGDETRRWQSGKTLMFDDTHLHEAWNLTGEHRVVLIVDTLNHNAP